MAEATHTAHTVLQPLRLPHSPDGLLEAFDACTDCDKRGMQGAGAGLFKLCGTCGGSREGGPSLGTVPDPHEHGLYVPGQTVHLSEEQAKQLVAEGKVAPAGSLDVEVQLVRAAAERLGLRIADAQ